MDMSETANVTFGGPVTVKMPIYVTNVTSATPPSRVQVELLHIMK